MRTLFVFILCLLALSSKGATPAFTSFIGSNSVTVLTNPATGKIIISGAPASGTSSTNPASAFTNFLWANTVFVDATNGNNSTAARGDASKPYLTMSNAFTALRTGDTLFGRPGEYPVLPGQSIGTGPLNLSHLTNVTLEMTGVRLTSSGLGPIFVITNCEGVTVRGVSIESPSKTNGALGSFFGAINIAGGGRNITFDGITISNAADSGITHLDWGQWGGGLTVRNSRFFNCGNTNGTADGTAVGVFGARSVVEGCYFERNFRDIEAWSAAGGIAPQLVNGVRVSGNISSNAIQHFYCSFHTNSTGVSITDNLVFRGGGHDWADPSAILLGHFNDAKVLGNTISGWLYGIRWVGASAAVQSDMALLDGNTIRDVTTAMQFHSDAGVAYAPRFVSILNNTVIGAEFAGIFATLDRGMILYNKLIDTGRTGGSGHGITLGYAGGQPGTNTHVIGNYVYNSGPTAYTDNTITIGSSAYGFTVHGNQIGPGLTAMSIGGNGTLGNDVVIHRAGVVTNIHAVHGPGAGVYTITTDAIELYGPAFGALANLSFGTYNDGATPLINVNGGGLRFLQNDSLGYTFIEAGSGRFAAASYVTNLMTAQAYASRATNITALLSGRYTNDWTGLLDGVVVFTNVQSSASLGRTNLLPSAATYPGREISVFDASMTAAGSNIYVATVSSQLINGAQGAGPTITNISANNGGLTLVSDGAGWRIKAAFP